MTLNSPEVNAIELEKSVLTLLDEFLKGFFDGGTHNVGRVKNVKFPRAKLAYQESHFDQPLDGLAITTVWTHVGKIMREDDINVAARDKFCVVACTWQLFARAKMVQGGDGGPEVQVRLLADRIYALFVNSHATKPLAQKGIYHLRPDVPVLVSNGSGGVDGSYYMRMVVLHGQLRFAAGLEPEAVKLTVSGIQTAEQVGGVTAAP